MKVISDHVHHLCNLFPDNVAIKIKNRVLTYKQLDQKALKLASILRKFGANNEAVAVVGQRKMSPYIGILATIYAGCYYIPVNTKYDRSKIRSILKDSKIRFIVGDKTDLIKLDLSQEELQHLAVEEIFIPEGISEGQDKNIWKYINSINDIEIMDKPVGNSFNRLAYIMYTSGSTGSPKGVMVTHLNLSTWIKNMLKIYKMEVGFKASQTYDLSFDLSVADLFFTWVNGGQLCVLPEDEQLMPAEYIVREKIEFWSSVPTQVSFLNKMGLLTPTAFPSIKVSIFCGEPLPKYLADEWKKAASNSTVENLYGPTEATIWLTRFSYTSSDVNKKFKNNILPIGNCFEDHTIALIDEQGNRLKNKQVGEIVYKGPQISAGYLNNKVKTKFAFKKYSWDSSDEIWYKSGDLGFYNSDGNLECLGRRDSQIKLAGRRVEIGEIESVLRSYPSLKDIVVVPVKDINQIVEFLVGFTTSDIDKKEEMRIRSNTEMKLERIFFPKKVLHIEIIPVTTSGKTDRNMLERIAREKIKN